MGPTWVLSAPDEPHVGPMNPAIRGSWNNSHLVRAVRLMIGTSARAHICLVLSAVVIGRWHCELKLEMDDLMLLDLKHVAIYFSIFVVGLQYFYLFNSLHIQYTRRSIRSFRSPLCFVLIGNGQSMSVRVYSLYIRNHCDDKNGFIVQ